MDQTLNSLVFSNSPDGSFCLRTRIGKTPVAAFSIDLKINGSPFRGIYTLDPDGHPQQNDCPFTQLGICREPAQIVIERSSLSTIDSEHTTMQGIITALIPAPSGTGNQYLTIFVDCLSVSKGRILLYSGMSKDIHSLYNALFPVSGTSNPLNTNLGVGDA